MGGIPVVPPSDLIDDLKKGVISVCLTGIILSSTACILRTPALLAQLNSTPSKQGEVPPKRSLETRIERLSKDHLADAYIDPTRVSKWMKDLGDSPSNLVTLIRCLSQGEDPDQCYGAFMDESAAWGLPAVPASMDPLKRRDSPEAGVELDAERFLANLRALASSLAVLEKLIGGGPLPEVDLTEGIGNGAHRAASYIAARSWHRSVITPSRAIVLSGGAANGAFSAGIIWRLMETLKSCREASVGGCPGAKIDLVVGTSTGALIGLLIDLYSMPGQEQKARDLLVQSYTCSVDSDLYCVNDKWDWALLKNLKGLVQFDRVRKKIETEVPRQVVTNEMEMVAVSVDFDSGDIYAQSDQDPEDYGTSKNRVNAILASIVEPVLGEPISELSRDGRPIKGTFFDGGVRSGLPLLEAVRRGAERVLVVATPRIDPDAELPAKNAINVIGRTVDLFAGQPRIAEVQLGELSALERRWLEYNVCKENRLAGLEPAEVVSFCERREGFFPTPEGPEGAVSGWMGPAHFGQVVSSWQTSWVFRPEEDVQTLGGYSFNPEAMRKLFELGAITFQRRCDEILKTLSIHGSVAHAFCKERPDDVLRKAKLLYRPLHECLDHKPKIRKCD